MSVLARMAGLGWGPGEPEAASLSDCITARPLQEKAVGTSEFPGWVWFGCREKGGVRCLFHQHWESEPKRPAPSDLNLDLPSDNPLYKIGQYIRQHRGRNPNTQKGFRNSRAHGEIKTSQNPDYGRIWLFLTYISRFSVDCSGLAVAEDLIGCLAHPAALPHTARVRKLRFKGDDNLCIKCCKLSVLWKLQIWAFVGNLRLSSFLSERLVLLFLPWN